MRLCAAYHHSFLLETHVRPALKSLLCDTLESASFFIRDQDMRICLFREDSAHTIRDHVREGDRLILNQGAAGHVLLRRSEEHTSELQSLMRISYAVFCLKKKKKKQTNKHHCYTNSENHEEKSLIESQL